MTTSTRILLLFDNNGREYVSRIQAGAARFGQAAGVRVDTENSFDSGRRIAEILADTPPAGIVVTPPYSDDRHALSLIEERRIPYVRIAPMLDPERGSTVIMDEYEAARAITEHLLERGHRRIGFVRGPRVHLVSMRRYNGYASALGGKRLTPDPALIVQGDFSRESGRQHAAALFAARPTAIFASNDEMAVGIIEAADRAGIAIPGAISLVGFDDNAVAKTVRPRLTSVRQPLEEMGETACQLLIERVRNPARPNAHSQLPFQIVERDSVAEPAPASVVSSTAA